MELGIARPFRQVRHLARYREIVQILIKQGFDDLVTRLGLPQQLSLKRIIRRETSTPLPVAVRVRMVLEELGPTFVKLGQILSTRPDLLPHDFIEEMEKLQDRVPPATWEAVRPIIEEELNAPLEELFAEVDPEPLAAASLAQVHSAFLHDGSQVVIKVQRPGIDKTVEVDLEILFELAALLQANTTWGEFYDLTAIAEEFAASLRRELDYYREAHNTRRFERNFASNEHIYVPKVYWDYVSRRVIVLERIYGIKIDHVAALDAVGYNRRAIALHAAELVVKQILEDGFFHADPHPGNLLVIRDEVIAVIDLGMVGWLDAKDRLELTRLFIAIISLDADGVVDQFIRMGMTNFGLDRPALRRDVIRIIQKYQSLSLKELRADEVLDDLQRVAFKHHLSLPSDLWLLFKTLVIVEGVGLKLDPDFDIFEVSKPYLEKLTQQLYMPQTWAPTVSRTTFGWASLLSLVPELAPSILRQAEQGKLQLVLEHKGLNHVTARIERVAGQISLSLITASLIIGTALVLPSFLGNLIGQWNLLIIVFAFLGASALGIWLLFSILTSGRER